MSCNFEPKIIEVNSVKITKGFGFQNGQIRDLLGLGQDTVSDPVLVRWAGGGATGRWHFASTRNKVGE